MEQWGGGAQAQDWLVTVEPQGPQADAGWSLVTALLEVPRVVGWRGKGRRVPAWWWRRVTAMEAAALGGPGVLKLLAYEAGAAGEAVAQEQEDQRAGPWAGD